MVLYRCECGTESDNRYNMRQHLNKEKFLHRGKDMSKVDIDSLCISRITKDLSGLTQEEKKQRQKEQIKAHDFKRGTLASKLELDYAKDKFKSIKKHSEGRNHELPSFWSPETVLSLLEKNRTYKVKTSIGLFEFSTVLTNGYHNSAVLDRIDDDIGYKLDNIEIRPHFLNTPRKLSTDDIKEIPILRETPRTDKELDDIVYQINLQPLGNNFFYFKACEIKNNCRIPTRKERNITFDFKSLEECRAFLVEQYIKQGGRCYYTNIPIFQQKNTKHSISVERLDPTKSYNKDNIVLIAVELNFPPKGQVYNKTISDGDRLKAIEAATFNQKYWDECTLLTEERRRKCEEAKEHDKKILEELLLF